MVSNLVVFRQLHTSLTCKYRKQETKKAELILTNSAFSSFWGEAIQYQISSIEVLILQGAPAL